MTSDLFKRQLASYAAVHRDRRNKATHFIGVPVIVFSMLLVLTLWRPQLGDHEVSGALVVAILTVLGWMALDLGIGLVMAAVMLVGWHAAESLGAALGSGVTWATFLVLFVGGWALQFVGHHYEGKRPALADNIFQIFIAPMFLVAETMVALGQRRDLALLVHQDDVTAR